MVWSDLLTDTAITRAVGREAFARGFVYARTGHVLHLELDDEELAIHGLVSGSSREPYRTRVYLKVGPTGTAGQHEGYCNCPITTNCKHAAAVMLATRIRLGGQAPPTKPAWERVLGRLVSTPVQVGVPTALGLQFELGSLGARPGMTVQLRPVRRGKSGRWVQTGVTWSDLQYDYGHRFDADQRDWLLRVQASAVSQQHTSQWSGGGMSLTATGAALWPLLDAAGEAGVTLVLTGQPHGTVRLASAPAETSIDVRADQTSTDRGQLLLEPVVRIEQRIVASDRLALVGDPAHGVAARVGTGPTAELLLARLAQPLDRELHDWLARGELVRVPAKDRSRFFDDYFPALQRRAVVVSHDGSVTLPGVAAPQLHLRLQHVSGGLLGLDWSFGYPISRSSDSSPDLFAADPESTVGPVRHFAVDDTQSQLAQRDRVTEEGLLTRLPLPSARWPVLADRPHPSGAASRARPRAHASLTGVDAADFCTEALPGLVAAGVVLTTAGDPVDYRRLESPPLITVSALERPGESDWFDLVVDVSIDGELVPFDQLFAALSSGVETLVLESGVYFSLDRPEFSRLGELIVEARALQDRDRPTLRLNRHQADFWQELLSLGVVDQQAERWLRTTTAVAALENPPEPPPTAVLATLRPYQQEGYAWLWALFQNGIGGILADDMGLGKTLQALALVVAARAPDPTAPPFLVVAPTSVVSTWSSEAARFAPGLRVVVVDRTTAKAGLQLADRVADADLVVTSYAVLRLDVDHWAGRAWQGLFLDEAQFVKNHQSKIYAATRRVGSAVPGGFVVAMTGTPLENSLMDLWSLLSITAPGMFPSPQRFASYFARPVERGEEPGRLLKLRHRIRPLMLRRTKEVVATDLPPKQEQVLSVPLHPRHARIYQTHLQRERQKVLGLIDELDEHRFTVLRSLTLLRQLSLDAALVDEAYEGVPSAKIELLTERLSELAAEGHRALVFSQFTRFLRRLQSRLDEVGVPVSYLDGSTADRAGAIRSFREGPSGAFLISLKAGGVGLNLTEADYCFVADPWWNPAAEAQAVDRAHRIGQTRPVMVYRLVTADTIEEKVMALKSRKLDLYSSVMGGDQVGSGGGAAALSATDVIDLLAD